MGVAVGCLKQLLGNYFCVFYHVCALNKVTEQKGPYFKNVPCTYTVLQQI